MSKFFRLNNISNWQSRSEFGRARGHQDRSRLEYNFDEQVLYYLSEKVINHLLDSLELEKQCNEQWRNNFSDFSFLTAPAYKAFEGFLFQIAKDLDLPSSGDPKFVGTYFDEEKVDKTIDKLLKELEAKSEKESKLSRQEKQHIKDMIKEMKRFLVHYRHTPAHFHGETMDTIEKAKQNTASMYRIINETVKVLLKVNLVTINDEVH